MLFVLLLCAVLTMAAAPSADESFAAIRNGDAGQLKAALDKGAASNARDGRGTPALMLAAFYANTDCVRLRLDHGADPNASDESGATALMWAVPDLAKTRLLVKRGAT